MVSLFANSGDPDQKPHSAASDLGLHCLLSTPFRDLQTTMGYTPSIGTDRIVRLRVEILGHCPIFP